MADARLNSEMESQPESPAGTSQSGEIPEARLPVPAEDSQRSSSSPSPNSNPSLGSAPTLSEESKLRLKDWEIESSQERKNTELYRTRCISDKTELYHLVGFYCVFSGVVFNTVGTSTRFTCQTSLLPALLITFAFLAVAVSVHYKLSDFEKDRRKLINSQHIADYAKSRISRLKADGDAWDFKTSKMNTKKLSQNLEQDRRSLTKFYWLVMTFLFLFSLVIFTCCVLIPCWNQKENTISLCAFTVCWEWHDITVTRHTL